MFNLFPFFTKTEAPEYNPWYGDISYHFNGKQYTPEELGSEFGKLQKQVEDAKLMSEERDNKWRTFNRSLHAQIKGLKEENEKLKDFNRLMEVSIEKWHSRAKSWEQLDEEMKTMTSELTKEVLSLRHLKQENADLMEILAKYRDGYQGSCYACEPVGELNQKLELQVTALHKVIEGAKETIDELKNDPLRAKLQIIQNDYAGCAQQRDEFKHQLNAAAKEITELKSKLRDYQDKYAQSFSYVDMNNMQKERDILQKWKDEFLLVESWWHTVAEYIREHEDAPLGLNLHEICLNFLNERDEFKHQLNAAEKEIAALKANHRTGYDGAASDYPEEYSKWLNEQKDKNDVNTWEQAASDLALRVAKLENNLLYNTTIPYSALDKNGNLKTNLC